MPGSGNSKSSRRSDGAASTVLCFFVSAAVMAAAVAYFYRSGGTLYAGDAEAHLDIARRLVDSRTPGWSQIGTTWLPLPHLLMVPLVRNDWMWRTGLAGAIVSALSTSLAAAFLFASVQRIYQSAAAAGGAVAVFLMNPNTLYLGSVPMTEPVFFAACFALLYCTVRGRDCGLRRGVDTIRRVVSNALRRSVYTDLRTRQTPLKTMGCRRPFLRDWRSRARSLAGAQPVVFRRPTLLLPWTLFRARHPGN